MGRPNLPEGAAKGVIVQTRVSDAERELLDDAAKASGLKLAKWMRERILAAAKAETGK